MPLAKVKVGEEIKEIEVGKGKAISEIMQELGLALDEYIPVLNGEVVTEFEEVKGGDSLEFFKVWSGG